jgi:hypothetical protein
MTGFKSKREAAQADGMTKEESLKLALEALELSAITVDSFSFQRKTQQAITAIKEALAQPAPPPECMTEAEQTAYAFGWWKALEHVRTEQPAQEPVAYIRKDQLQKAAQSATLCEVTSEPRQDRIGIYTAPLQRPLVDEAPIRADEREACALLCDAHKEKENLFAEERYAAHWLAEAIRARGNT